MSNLRLSIVLFVFTLFLASPGCKQDDDALTPDDEPLTIDIGSYSLLPGSIEQIPYLGQSEIIFLDSTGAEAIFKIDEQGLFQSDGAKYFRYDVEEPGDTVHYLFNTEIKSLNLECGPLDMKFRLSLTARPYYPDPESQTVADILEINLQLPAGNGAAARVFYHEVDTRSYPDSFNNEPIPEIELLGRTFNEVIWNNYFNPTSEVYFNFEYGIVSFTDHDGKQWRFEEMR